MNASHTVPTIDFGANDRAQRNALDAACAEHGFFLLTGHGCDDVIARTWDTTRAFFDAPRATRLAVTRDAANPLGYYDRELTKRRRDTKEVFDFVDPDFAKVDARNRWPADLPALRATAAEFFAAMSALSVRTLALLRTTLGTTDNDLPEIRCDRRTSTVRLNHYPLVDPVPVAERATLPPLGDTALGYHTDPGVLTLLLQDDTGGLQTQARDGQWIDVPPRAGTIVVNLGDTLQAWTNDRYRAAVHRVLPMTSRRHFSIPYFANPPRDAVLEPLLIAANAQPCYRPVGWREFIQARVDDNYTDLGSDDTQLAQFRR